MKTITRTIVSLSALLSCLGVATAARADHGYGGYQRIERLVDSVQAHTREVFVELRYNFNGSPCYREMTSDAADVYRTATRMRVAARNAGGLRQLHNDVHRLERLVANMHEEAHHLDSRRARHLCHLIMCLEDLVDDLDDQVLAMNDRRAYDGGYSVGYPSRLNQGGIYIGGRGFGVQFGR